MGYINTFLTKSVIVPAKRLTLLIEDWWIGVRCQYAAQHRRCIDNVHKIWIPYMGRIIPGAELSPLQTLQCREVYEIMGSRKKKMFFSFFFLMSSKTQGFTGDCQNLMLCHCIIARDLVISDKNWFRNIGSVYHLAMVKTGLK